MNITVVGMGPGDMSYLTLEAFETLTSGKKVYLRTDKHPVVEDLAKRGMVYESFDHMYDSEESFDNVYSGIVRELERMSESEGDIIYGVPGNPLVAERTVELLIERKNADIGFIYGPSFIDATLMAVKRDPANGFSVIDALSPWESGINVYSDNLFVQVYDPQIASELKLKLSALYGDDYICMVVRAAGIKGMESILETPIYEMDQRGEFDHLTSVFIPQFPLDYSTERFKFFEDLVRVVAKLRGPDGCPWDIKQTHESLGENLIEEAYEVLDAIKNEDLWGLEEELGDVLLQVVMHAEIASESGYFDIKDVTTGIVNKLITRHPHVFGDVKLESSHEVIAKWEEIKLEEKKETVSESMKRVPKALPSLSRAYKIQKKAANSGFDWENGEGALEKIDEEILELKESISKGDRKEIQSEIGDLLFSIVNVCRFLKINPDIALEVSTEKFMSRFDFIEKSIQENGQKMKETPLLELENLWKMAKKFEK